MAEITFRQQHSEAKRVYADGHFIGVVVFLNEQWWALDKTENTLGSDSNRIGAARILADAN